jgi:hypothetical protein
MRRSNDRSKNKGETWGKRSELTLAQDPELEQRLPGGDDESPDTLTTTERR